MKCPVIRDKRVLMVLLLKARAGPSPEVWPNRKNFIKYKFKNGNLIKYYETITDAAAV